MVVLGDMSLGGNIVPIENRAESRQIAFESGAKRILVPMASARDIPTIPGASLADKAKHNVSQGVIGKDRH